MSNDKMKSPGAEPQGVELKMSDRKRDTAGTVERRLEELKEKLKNHVPTPDEVRRAREFMTNEANIGAIDQISRAIADGVGTCSAIERQLSASCFYHTFLVGDGQESALSRLMVMMTEGAASCAERGVTLDAPGRGLELNLAAKLALTVAALSDAIDRHRCRNLPK
jgi:hypothetical protein